MLLGLAFETDPRVVHVLKDQLQGYLTHKKTATPLGPP